MITVAIIFASILFLLGILLIPFRIVAAPATSFLGMLVLDMPVTEQGSHIVPISNGMLLGWLFMTILVTVVTILQPRPVRDTRRGIYYFIAGAITGMALGLLGFTISPYPGTRYLIMIIAVAAGTILGALMYGSTPDGKNVGVTSGNFFSYLLAKGFPTAISVMQLATVLVLLGL